MDLLLIIFSLDVSVSDAHRASDADSLNKRRRHVSLHHLVLGSLNRFLSHLQHTHKTTDKLSLAPAIQEAVFKYY